MQVLTLAILMSLLLLRDSRVSYSLQSDSVIASDSLDLVRDLNKTSAIFSKKSIKHQHQKLKHLHFH